MRTTVIVRFRRIRAIVTVDKTLGCQGGNVQRTESVIEELLAIQREAGVGFEHGGVAGVGRGCSKSGAKRSRVVGDSTGSLE